MVDFGEDRSPEADRCNFETDFRTGWHYRWIVGLGSTMASVLTARGQFGDDELSKALPKEQTPEGQEAHERYLPENGRTVRGGVRSLRG